ncbi:hypothetical protein Ferp_0669 [Ferroglobus placidus DSM 10642]|uniref:Uncharacterized protein n=1 Tax=Ferroglobus placidus (strain DSM 10642 / AEDII12DO) TaxID=589924 RepID=D3S3K7_FERPA|nr:hypothetical protein [Ferroglobus placidus]ADC64840.1 hypothetical protein Ferp_0669 [Ferroglobus placidus DSM 10642]
MMLTPRVILSIVILLAVGVLVLPSTVSLFAGQHDWYNIDARGNDIPCEKCHADVYDELKNNPYHENFTCDLCHRAINISYASGYSNGPDMSYEWGAHAASTVSCLVCHSGPNSGEGAMHEHHEVVADCSVCHSPSPTDYPPVAGGFGLTGEANDTGTYAAHRQFVLDAKNNSLMTSANEACIACHTHVPVRINWSHAVSLELNATQILSEWTTENYNANGTAVRIVWGNAEGTGGLLYNGTTTKSWGTGTWP